MKDTSKYLPKHKHSIAKYKREYNSWYSMKQRCTNPDKDNYFAYGGKGITVCHRWLDSFDNFVEDMGKRPEGTTLDRIDSSGNYEPSNCKWSTYSEQTLNTTSTYWIDDNGEEICLTHFAKKYKIPPTTLKHRIKNGLSLDDLKTPPKEKLVYKISYNGKEYGQREICREFSLPKTTLRRKTDEGMSLEQALAYCFNRKGIHCCDSDFTVTTEKHPYKWLDH